MIYSLNKLELAAACLQIRKDILEMTTKAGSGHLTSSLSAVELLVCLTLQNFFVHPDYPTLLSLSEGERHQLWQAGEFDRLLFSKGHASPLFYALYKQFAVLTKEDLLTFRQFDSVLEGHPTPRFWPTEATTGSLGQGLGIGAGLAWGLKTKFFEKNQNLAKETESKLKETKITKSKNLAEKTKMARVFVLLGDSEMAEGSIWETMNFAAYYQLYNLIAIVDMNRLGQTGPTQHGHDLETLAAKCSSFGWQVVLVDDGHNLVKLTEAYQEILNGSQNLKPKMLIAKTIKGKGIKFLEDQNGWHGKVLNQEQYLQALAELEADKLKL